jgi:hypothetical protein
MNGVSLAGQAYGNSWIDDRAHALNAHTPTAGIFGIHPHGRSQRGFGGGAEEALAGAGKYDPITGQP